MLLAWLLAHTLTPGINLPENEENYIPHITTHPFVESIFNLCTVTHNLLTVRHTIFTTSSSLQLYPLVLVI